VNYNTLPSLFYVSKRIFKDKQDLTSG